MKGTVVLIVPGSMISGDFVKPGTLGDIVVLANPDISAEILRPVERRPSIAYKIDRPEVSLEEVRPLLKREQTHPKKWTKRK